MSKQLENAPLLKTTLVAYKFDTNHPQEAEAYKALKAELKGRGLKCFETWGGGNGHYIPFKKLNGQTIELETGHLYSNQWNTAPIPGKSGNGLRVFDWAQDYPIDFPENIKRGHYLAQTEEMREIRDKVYKCGYCDSMHWAAKGLVFCDQCLGSEYLKESDLKLLKLRPVRETKGNSPELTQGEKDYILPLYVAAQTEGASTRAGQQLAKQRKDIISKCDKTVEAATTEREGMLWLMDHNIPIGNCIYYSHTNKFSFGWRQAVSDSVRDRLLEVISEFPFPYEIKCSDGKTLKGH